MPRKVEVYCVELDKKFKSAQDAALWLNRKDGRTHIIHCCKNKCASAFGFTWRYVNPKDQITVTNKPIFNINTNTRYANAKAAAKANGLSRTDSIYKACRTGSISCNCQWCFYQPDMENWDPNDFLFIWD